MADRRLPSRLTSVPRLGTTWEKEEGEDGWESRLFAQDRWRSQGCIVLQLSYLLGGPEEGRVEYG